MAGLPKLLTTALLSTMPSHRASTPTPIVQAALLLLLAYLPLRAVGHGALTKPRARGTLRTYSLGLPDVPGAHVPADGCPHCLNGGGTGAVGAASPGGWRPYRPFTPGGRHAGAGPCGDRASDRRPRAHERGGNFCPAAALDVRPVYRSGSEIEIEVAVTTNHNGYFEFFLCDVARCGGDPSPQCFKGGHCRQLRRARVPECESGKSRQCAPTDPQHPGRFYVPCRLPGTQFVHMRYLLPKGFVCKDCVLQWYWATANSCNPPGVTEFFKQFPMKSWGQCPGDGGSIGGRNPMLALCGGDKIPEEFWMCADVRVESGGKGGKEARVEHHEVTEAEKHEDEHEEDHDGDHDDDDIDDHRSFSETFMPAEGARRERYKHEWKPESMTHGAWMAAKAGEKETKAPSQASKTSISGTGKEGGMCVANWHQCGGLHYKGPTRCCSAGLQCVSVNKYYAHCKPSTSR